MMLAGENHHAETVAKCAQMGVFVSKLVLDSVCRKQACIFIFLRVGDDLLINLSPRYLTTPLPSCWQRLKVCALAKVCGLSVLCEVLK